MFNIIKPLPVREYILAELRHSIYSGALKPGERLSQDKLALQLGVSRMPVREAIQILESEGMVDYVVNRGAIVKTLSVGFVDDHFNTRQWMESLAIERACKNGLDNELLKKNLEGQRSAFDKKNAKLLSEWGFALCNYVYECAKSPLLAEYLLQMLKQQPRFYAKEPEESYWIHIGNVFDLEKRIVSSLIERDSEVATRLSCEKLDLVRIRLLKFYQHNN